MQFTQVESHLAQFDGLVQSLKTRFDIEELAPRIVVIKPKHYAKAAGEVRDIHLSLTGLIHGVEVAGLSILCKFLAKLDDGTVVLSGPIGVAVGNAQAALNGVRFVERDLNRSFARASVDTAEDRRADELELLFNRTKYLLDFHQVKLPTASPFWIFPYHKEGLSFARAIAPQVPVVTHWGKSFSADGQCSDEYVIKTGACGVTIELGQNGFDPAQIHNGVQVALAALREVRMRVGGETRGPRIERALAPIYTWAEVMPYPNTGAPVLDQGWTNFATVTKGQRLGVFQDQEVLAPVDGWLLFPKYPDRKADGTFGLSPPAAELVRIMRRIDERDLPEQSL